MIPGRLVHRVAALVCSKKSLERVIEPAIADLQREYSHAADRGARMTNLARGYVSVFRVIAACALDMSDTTFDDRRAVMRTLAWWFGLTCAIVALLCLPPLWTYPIALKYPSLAITLLPQAAPLAIPVGLAFGIALGVGRAVTLNAGKMILLAAAMASLLSFGILEWALPASNQVFTDFTSQILRSRGYKGPMTGPQKGPNEMRLAELRREIRDAEANGESRRAQRYSLAFYFRFALAGATFTLALFLLTLPANRLLARGLLALGACFSYWMLMYLGELAMVHRYVTPLAGAWLPNAALVAAAMLVLSVRPRHSSGSVAVP
jgi:lipopolysaccharide export LptBFGC system permease protein LptF